MMNNLIHFWMVYMGDVATFLLATTLVLTLLYVPYTLLLRKEHFFRQNRFQRLFHLMKMPIICGIAAEICFLQLQQQTDILCAVLTQPAAQQLPIRFQGNHVPLHQQNCLLPQSGGSLQPPQDRICQLGADLRMIIEMTAAVFVKGKGGGFAHIMEQCRPPQCQNVRCPLHHPDGVSVNVVEVVGVMLLKAYTGGKLRDGGGNDGGESMQIPGVANHQEFT